MMNRPYPLPADWCHHTCYWRLVAFWVGAASALAMIVLCSLDWKSLHVLALVLLRWAVTYKMLNRAMDRDRVVAVVLMLRQQTYPEEFPYCCYHLCYSIDLIRLMVLWALYHWQHPLWLQLQSPPTHDCCDDIQMINEFADHGATLLLAIP